MTYTTPAGKRHAFQKMTAAQDAEVLALMQIQRRAEKRIHEIFDAANVTTNKGKRALQKRRIWADWAERQTSAQHPTPAEPANTRQR